jgi:hypothetical protein
MLKQSPIATTSHAALLTVARCAHLARLNRQPIDENLL